MKPTYQREAETEMRNALEKAEEEDRKSLRVSQEMQDKRSQLIRIRQGVEAMKREREIAKKENEEDAQLVEEKKEKKRKENEKTYLNISLAQKAKVAELNTKLNWLHAKQEGKLRRINSKEGKHLNLEQKMKFKNLKQSSKKLEKKIFHTQEEISRRKATVKRLRALRENCRINPNPIAENPTFTDFELASIPVTRCWEVKDNHEERAHGSVQHSAPPPTPAVLEIDNLARPLNEQPKNQEEAPVPEKRPLTRRLAKRLNPKTLVTRLQRHLSKKSHNSRPLGAHPGRLRSVTENMQEIIPYEMQHYDSDPEDVPDQPACTMNQTAHTAEQTMPLSGVHGQGRSDRHFVISPEREIEMNEGHTYTMGRQLQSGSQPEYSSFRNGTPCNTPSRNRISSCRRYEVPEVDSSPIADAQTLHQPPAGETRRSNSEYQMNDGDCLLARSESPKTPHLKWTTQPQVPQMFSDTTDEMFESKPDSGSPIAQHPVPTVTKLLTMQQTRPITRRHQRVAQPLQRMQPVDNLLENKSELGESSAQSTSSHKSSVRPLTRQQQRVAQPLRRMSPVNNLLENKSELEESSAQSTLIQMSNKSSVRPQTRKQQRVTQPLRRSVNNLLENNSELGESSAQSSSFQMTNKILVRPLTRRQQRTETTSQKIERYIAAEVNRLQLPEWKESNATSRSHREPTDRDLLAIKFERPKRPESVGQRRQDEAVRRYSENAGKSSVNLQHGSEQNENPRKPVTSRQTRAQEEGAQRHSLDDVDKFIDGEIEWEELCASSTAQQRPKKPVSMGQRRREEAVRRYFENANKASSSPENRTCLLQERCRDPVTRLPLNLLLADSSRLRH